MSFQDVVLAERLKALANANNPHVPEDARTDAINQLLRSETPSLLEENQRLHKLLTRGATVEYRNADGAIVGDKVRFLDLDGPDNNDWLIVNQFTVVEGRSNRRPDLVVFVNGLPLAELELKNPGTETATLDADHRQLQIYKRDIQDLFRTICSTRTYRIVVRP